MYKLISHITVVCLNSNHLAPGASEVGLGTAALAPLPRDHRPEESGRSGGKWDGLLMCAGIVLESHLLGIGRPTLAKTYYMTLGRPRRPTWHPKTPESGPRVAQVPKRTEKSTHGKERKLKDTQRRPTNHRTIYMQTIYRQTPDQTPYSSRLV